MSTVNILCGHHHYPELALLSWAWSSQVATEMLSHSSMTTSRSWRIFETSVHLHLLLEDPPKMFYWVQVWRHAWPVHHLSLFSKAVDILEVCLGSLSCWNTALRPSFWIEGIMLCCSISQYMLEFMFSSIKFNSPTPAALMQPHLCTPHLVAATHA